MPRRPVTDEWLRKQRLLVVSPHADDEAFGCAGTIAKVKALGGQVYVMCLSVGDLHHYDGRHPFVTGATRRQEFVNTMKLLKVDGYDVVFDDPERHLRLDAMPRRDVIAAIERDSRVAIDRVKPTIIALPARSYNQDHCAVFEAGFTACRPHLATYKPFQSVVLAYDSPTLSWNTERFHPNFYVDISQYLPLKLKAIRIHASQQKDPLHHCSFQNLAHLAHLRGREISVEAAEAFMCYRFVI